MPMIDRYRQQVEVWRSMDEKPELTAEDITTILEVRGGTVGRVEIPGAPVVLCNLPLAQYARHYTGQS